MRTFGVFHHGAVQLHQVVHQGITPGLPPRYLTVAPLSPEQAGQAYQDSGRRYEQAAARALAQERGRGPTFILAGYGAGLRVEHDALIVSEGRTHDPQSPPVHALYRGLHDVARIVCLAPRGTLSFEAIRWCHEQTVTVLLIDRDGQLLACLTPEAAGDIALRHCQYMAGAAGRDVAVAQWLVRRKIQGQRETLVRFPALPGAKAGVQKLHELLAWFDLPSLPPWLCRGWLLSGHPGDFICASPQHGCAASPVAHAPPG